MIKLKELLKEISEPKIGDYIIINGKPSIISTVTGNKIRARLVVDLTEAPVEFEMPKKQLEAHPSLTNKWTVNKKQKPVKVKTMPKSNLLKTLYRDLKPS